MKFGKIKKAKKNLKWYFRQPVNLNQTFSQTEFTQQTFQSYVNVVFRLIWCRDVAHRQINVETTLCRSTLEFTTLSHVESTLPISALIWRTLDNVIFNFNLRKIGQHWNDILNMTILKKINLKANTKQYFWASRKNYSNWIQWTKKFIHIIPYFNRTI